MAAIAAIPNRMTKTSKKLERTLMVALVSIQASTALMTERHERKE